MHVPPAGGDLAGWQPRPRCRRPPSARSRKRPPRTPRGRNADRPASRGSGPSPRAHRGERPGSPRCPSFPGMTTSIRITSGFVSRVWKTAFRASPASPTTSMSVLGLEHLAQAGADDGVVVDDQDADRLAHLQRDLGHDRRAGVRARLDFSLPPSSASRSPIPSRPRPSRAASGMKPRPSSSITAVIARRPAREHDADRARLRVLDDVRQRLLDDPVERGLDVARQPVADAAPPGRRAFPVCSAKVSRSRSSAATRPKSSSAFGRSSTASRRTSCSVSTTCSRTAASAAVRSSSLLASSTRLQPEQHRRQLLPGLVVQLARQPARARAPAPRRPGAARRRATRAERSTATAARGRERLGEPQVGLGEARVAAFACRARR